MFSAFNFWPCNYLANSFLAELSENLPKFASSFYLLSRQALGFYFYFFSRDKSQGFCIFVCKLLNVSATGLDDKI